MHADENNKNVKCRHHRVHNTFNIFLKKTQAVTITDTPLTQYINTYKFDSMTALHIMLDGTIKCFKTAHKNNMHTWVYQF